jgi:hypothetical protein
MDCARVFENMVLRRVIGRKREEVTGGWRMLHNEDIHNLFSAPNNIRMIKSKGMRCTGHELRIDEKGKQSFGRRL